MIFIFSENERNCTNNFCQGWNHLVDYCARSGYDEHEKIERTLEEPVDASIDPSASNAQFQAIEAKTCFQISHEFFLNLYDSHQREIRILLYL